MSRNKKNNIGKDVIFSSVRCHARPFTEDDIDYFMLYRNNPEWMRFQGFKCMDRKEYETVLLREASLEEGVQYAVVRKSDKKLIGDVYVKKEGTVYWIGYAVNPEHKRRGYAFETVLALIDWINSMKATAIMAEVDAANTASVNLLEKAGFVRTKEDTDGLIYSWDTSLE